MVRWQPHKFYISGVGFDRGRKRVSKPGYYDVEYRPGILDSGLPKALGSSHGVRK
jgi:hypothetical protein